MRGLNWLWLPLLASLLAARSGRMAEGQPSRDNSAADLFFRIDVVDAETSRGVPGVRLEMARTAGVVYATDSAGVIAFREPGLENADVYFRIAGDGYVLDPHDPSRDGVTLRVRPGGRAEVMVHRLLAAERLYRINGLDPYRDSRLLGSAPSYAEPLRAKIIGQDSAFVTRYRNRLFWIWGDTTGLGPPKTWNYEATGATSIPPAQGGMNPNRGVDLDYFVDKQGFARPMIAAEDGGAITWLDGLTAFPSDGSSEGRLFALYVQMRRVPKVKPMAPGEARHITGMWWTDDALAREVELRRRRALGQEEVDAYLSAMDASTENETRVTRGLLEYDAQEKVFRRVATFPPTEIEALHIGSHSLRSRDGGDRYVYFSGLAPNRRVPDSPDAIQDIDRYEAFTCLKPTASFALGDFQPGAEQLDRDGRGRLRYGWKAGAYPVGPREQAKLVERELIEPGERWFVLCDVRSGVELITQHHSIHWNPYRNRYLGVFSGVRLDATARNPAQGPGTLSQIWYGEADAILGPWGYLEKVVDLGDYAYYNPLYNPFFDQQGGRLIYFEGTYTQFIKRTGQVRPRYNYNQVMHRLDLDDPRVALPVAVYAIEANDRRWATLANIPTEYDGPRHPRFFAPDRPRPRCVPIYERVGDFAPTLSTSPGPQRASRLAFYAVPADAAESEPACVPLYLRQNAQGVTTCVAERTNDNTPPRDKPLCYVWPLTTDVQASKF